MNATTQLDRDLEERARRRAGAKMGWYVYATVFILVNMMLAGISLMSGRSWAIFPAFGWGLGLAIHGFVVFFVAGGGLHERLLQRERERLTLQRDAW